ncbi:MAG: HesA/MoeB/ThiF family protein [Candidatus Bipolaricaulota bacterium]
MSGVWSQGERERYARHFVLPGFGESGQQKLRRARALVVGVGGLGSPVALYLAAAGLGTLHLVDADRVSVSNLQRQIVHGTATVGRPKPESAAVRLADLNPATLLELTMARFSSANARTLVRDADIVVDGTDNLKTRFLINEACLERGIPFVYGAVSQYEGQTGVLCLSGGPCYRCLFPLCPPEDAVPDPERVGLLAVVPGVIGTLQAAAAIRWITRYAETPVGRLQIYDARLGEVFSIEIARDPACPACGGATGGSSTP